MEVLECNLFILFIYILITITYLTVFFFSVIESKLKPLKN